MSSGNFFDERCRATNVEADRHAVDDRAPGFRFGIRALFATTAVIAFLLAAMRWLCQGREDVPLRNIVIFMVPWVCGALVGRGVAAKVRLHPVLGGLGGGAIGAFLWPGLVMLVSGGGISGSDLATFLGIGTGGGTAIAGIIALVGTQPSPRHTRSLFAKAATLLLTVAAILLFVVASRPRPPWTYDGQFHRTIVAADRIVIRDGGFGDASTTGAAPIIREITDPTEIKVVFDNFGFQENQWGGVCSCDGYPGLDWYQGQRCIAHTSVQHGKALRWDGFDGDGRLTKKSGQWLRSWLAQHGVAPDKIE